MATGRDDRKPVTFKLPKRDNVELITWAFVIDQLRENLINPMVEEIRGINASLDDIDKKLDEWIEEE